VRLRVGGCTPACARDGLTGCRCRDQRYENLWMTELFESEFEEDGTYHGSFTIDDQLVSYTVGELTVGD
jgi:hypothetical protein